MHGFSKYLYGVVTNNSPGCKNLGKGCDFDGFHPCRYSPEGLCYKCELKEFPGRYKGCAFCRTPMRHGKCCLQCIAGFDKWVNKHTNIKNADQASHRLTTRFSKGYKLGLRNKQKFIIIKRELFYEWPGFYVGNNKWSIIPELDLHTEENETWDNCHIVLDKLLKSFGINIDETIQYNLKIDD